MTETMEDAPVSRGYSMIRDHMGGGRRAGLFQNQGIEAMREQGALLFRPELLNAQKIVNFDPRLFQNRPESSLGHFARVVGKGRIEVRFFVIPDLMASWGLPIKSEPEGSKPSHYVFVSESGKPPIFRNSQ